MTLNKQEWEKQFDEEFKGELAVYDRDGEGGYDPRPYIKSFITSQNNKLISDILEEVGEDIPNTVELPTHRDMGERVVECINRERARFRAIINHKKLR